MALYNRVSAGSPYMDKNDGPSRVAEMLLLKERKLLEEAGYWSPVTLNCYNEFTNQRTSHKSVIYFNRGIFVVLWCPCRVLECPWPLCWPAIKQDLGSPQAVPSKATCAWLPPTMPLPRASRFLSHQNGLGRVSLWMRLSLFTPWTWFPKGQIAHCISSRRHLS